jgi:hypothetical protein
VRKGAKVRARAGVKELTALTAGSTTVPSMSSSESSSSSSSLDSSLSLSSASELSSSSSDAGRARLFGGGTDLPGLAAAFVPLPATFVSVISSSSILLPQGSLVS